MLTVRYSFPVMPLRADIASRLATSSLVHHSVRDYWYAPCIHLDATFDVAIGEGGVIIAPRCIDRMDVVSTYLSACQDDSIDDDNAGEAFTLWFIFLFLFLFVLI